MTLTNYRVFNNLHQSEGLRNDFHEFPGLCHDLDEFRELFVDLDKCLYSNNSFGIWIKRGQSKGTFIKNLYHGLITLMSFKRPSNPRAS